jgi:serine/threonine-protein kinase
MTGLNAIVGTALYMAPEQVAKGNVTPATDIYALGAVAYHCLAGRPPFDGDNALQVALRHLEDDPDPLPPDVPQPVRALIARAMAKHPADRFASAEDLAAAARAANRPTDWRALTGTATSAPLSPAPTTRTMPVPPNLPPAAPIPVRQPGTPRSQRMVQLAVVLLFLTAIGLALAIWLGQNDDPSGNGNPIDQPSVGTSGNPTAGESARPATNPTTRGTPRRNGVPGPTRARPSTSATSRAPATSAPATEPTTAPTTPATEPTTAPTTPATESPTTGSGDGTGGGTGD